MVVETDEMHRAMGIVLAVLFGFSLGFWAAEETAPAPVCPKIIYNLEEKRYEPVQAIHVHGDPRTSAGRIGQVSGRAYPPGTFLEPRTGQRSCRSRTLRGCGEPGCAAVYRALHSPNISRPRVGQQGADE